MLCLACTDCDSRTCQQVLAYDHDTLSTATAAVSTASGHLLLSSKRCMYLLAGAPAAHWLPCGVLHNIHEWNRFLTDRGAYCTGMQVGLTYL